MNGHVSSQTEWVSIVGRLPPVDCFIVIMTQILRFYMQRNWKIKVKHGIYSLSIQIEFKTYHLFWFSTHFFFAPHYFHFQWIMGNKIARNAKKKQTNKCEISTRKGITKRDSFHILMPKCCNKDVLTKHKTKQFKFNANWINKENTKEISQVNGTWTNWRQMI